MPHVLGACLQVDEGVGQLIKTRALRGRLIYEHALGHLHLLQPAAHTPHNYQDQSKQ